MEIRKYSFSSTQSLSLVYREVKTDSCSQRQNDFHNLIYIGLIRAGVSDARQTLRDACRGLSDDPLEFFKLRPAVLENFISARAGQSYFQFSEIHLEVFGNHTPVTAIYPFRASALSTWRLEILPRAID